MSPLRFTLSYRGSLKADSIKDKQNIRLCLHDQLKTLWSGFPFDEFHDRHFTDPDSKRLVGKVTYLPLVRKSAHLIAELDILLLRNEVPGRIIVGGGDIDNRLKTLFDALRCPHSAEEAGSQSHTDSEIYTLLEDDSLITAVGVTTDRLLEQCSPEEALLIVRVSVVPINFPVGGIQVI